MKNTVHPEGVKREEQITKIINLKEHMQNYFYNK